ncbi:MAG: hypothetical protein NPINA01_13210 [Nitrospinaceae bacterium]|nr:MAG: hypothetical protein NPINA01_13210 [Nitrospinaceae bacterium]
MTQFNISRLFFSLFLLFFTASCSQLFETDVDVQAKKALTDLMEIQETFYSENQRYARNLVEIDKYNLKYHSGLVYLEIESAGKDSYRAISLPAESLTARVFAFDTSKGGYYEMDEIEVSQYVLGALNHIRKVQSNKRISEYFFFFLLAILFIFGIRFQMSFKGTTNSLVFTAFYLSLIPLIWSFSVLNYMSTDIVFSGTLAGISGGALILAVLAILIGIGWLKGKKIIETPSSLLSLLGMTLIISIFDAGVMVHTFLKYSA